MQTIKNIVAPWDENIRVVLSQTKENDIVHRKILEVNPENWYIAPEVRSLLEMGYSKQRSEVWLEQRKLKITGSKVGIVANDNAPATKEAHFMVEVGLTPGFVGDKCTQHGTRYEPHALLYYMYNVQHLGFSFGLIEHHKYHFLGGSPDMIRDDGLIVEIKCPYNRKEARIKNLFKNKILKNYRCQIQLMLEITGQPLAHYVEYYPPLFGTDHEMYIVEVPRDQEWFKSVLPTLKRYYARLVFFVSKRHDLIRKIQIQKYLYSKHGDWKHLLLAYYFHIQYLRLCKKTKQMCFKSKSRPIYKKRVYSKIQDNVNHPSNKMKWRQKN